MLSLGIRAYGARGPAPMPAPVPTGAEGSRSRWREGPPLPGGTATLRGVEGMARVSPVPVRPGVSREFRFRVEALPVRQSPAKLVELNREFIPVV